MNQTSRIILTSLALAALALSGCAAKKQVYVRQDAPKVAYEKEKFIVLPVNIHGLPGDSNEYNAALFAGFVSAFGESGISLQPIQPALESAGLGDLPADLAHGIHHAVSAHNAYDLSKDPDQQNLHAIPELTAKLVEASATALKLEHKPRYVVVAHVDGLGDGTLPETYKYRVIGAIYDTQLHKVHAVTYYEATTAKKALIGEMGTIGTQLYQVLSSAQEG